MVMVVNPQDTALGLQYLCRNDAIAEMRRTGDNALLERLRRAVSQPDVAAADLVSGAIDALGWRADYELWAMVAAGTRGPLDDFPGTPAILSPVFTCPLADPNNCGRRSRSRSAPPACTLGNRAMAWTGDEFTG
ncbi:hypothetical protein [Nocardia sp. NPDC051832]|uniref:hypothetical protein n=1 Tax=Nocardia sp. NPDC051832 TaxID=3155673 RepID=UPI003448DA8E